MVQQPYSVMLLLVLSLQITYLPLNWSTKLQLASYFILKPFGQNWRSRSWFMLFLWPCCNRSVHQSTASLYACVSVSPPICPTIRPSVSRMFYLFNNSLTPLRSCLSVKLSFCLSVCKYVGLPLCIFLFLFSRLSICLYVCLAACSPDTQTDRQKDRETDRPM